MTTILQDVQHAVRACWKSPGFAAAAILTLALGIGVLSSAVGLIAGARSERVIAEFVTANYFQVLGVRLRIGPGFSGEDELRGGPPTAIVSHGVWQDLFGGDGSIVGKSVLVNGAAFTIVGVAPQEFEGITRGQRSGVWLTIPQFFAARSRPATAMDLRTTSFLALVGRLALAATTERVEQEMTAAVRTLASVPGAGVWHVRTRPASSGNTGLVDPLETPLRMLMVAVGLILVIAAANVANLFLARSPAGGRRTPGASRCHRERDAEETVLAEPRCDRAGVHDRRDHLRDHRSRARHEIPLRAELVSWLAALALALAAIGIYGVVSFTVAERTREMGIRLALGAEPGRLLRLVLMSGVRFAAAGIALGLLLSLWLTRIVAAEHYGVSRTDGVTLATTPRC